ncbi:hypothetical protein [Dialister sp.]|uniref:hypothetical protein n=1 Tax=Dialister sp. TaxID=1955814 RepID=UPI00406D5067
MYSYGAFSVLIKDFPDLPKQKKYIGFSGHRFRCTSCGEAITEDIPFCHFGHALCTLEYHTENTKAYHG